VAVVLDVPQLARLKKAKASYDQAAKALGAFNVHRLTIASGPIAWYTGCPKTWRPALAAELALDDDDDEMIEELIDNDKIIELPPGIRDPHQNEPEYVRTEIDVAEIGETGIFWSAREKHSDANIETQEISWDVVFGTAAGRKP
jgi:hypothetical protein